MSKSQQKTSTAPVIDPAIDAAVEIDAQTRRAVEKMVARINGLIGEAGQRYDQIADQLVTQIYAGDVQRALDPRKDPPPAFVALLGHVGDTLLMSRTQLFQAVRVGALNRRLGDTKWADLPWSTKVELLPLVGAEQDLKRLAAGVRMATEGKKGMRAVRAWVVAQLSGDPAATDVAPAPSFIAGRNAIGVAMGIGKAADRRRWVNRFVKLPDDERAQLLSGVKLAARNLEKLAQDLEAAVEGE